MYVSRIARFGICEMGERVVGRDVANIDISDGMVRWLEVGIPNIPRIKRISGYRITCLRNNIFSMNASTSCVDGYENCYS